MTFVGFVLFAREDIRNLTNLSPSSKEGMLSKQPLLRMDSIKSPVKWIMRRECYIAYQLRGFIDKRDYLGATPPRTSLNSIARTDAPAESFVVR